MNFKLFGFEIRRQPKNPPESFTAPQRDDGAIVVQAQPSAAVGGAYGTYVDLEGSARNEAELITRYRQMAIHPIVDTAVNDISNEAVAVDDEEEDAVKINLDGIQGLDPRIAGVIEQEFKGVLDLLEFHIRAYDVFRSWYVDGRLYYHAIIDRDQPEAGVQEFRKIDPRKLRKVREVDQRRDPNTNEQVVQATQNEYYVYSERGFDYKKLASDNPSAPLTALKIAKDSIIAVPSGVVDETGQNVISHLHKAIRYLNILKNTEDASVIYRLARAPERRVFYIDVGNMPKARAEEHLRDMMNKHKNRLVYDQTTGQIRDDRKFMAMLEDYWIPRREGSQATDIETLPPGANLGQIEDIEYFQKLLMKSLNVPVSRLIPEDMYSLGRAGEITREEVSFTRFIDRLRVRFNVLFLECLKLQLVLKGIVSIEDWDKIGPRIRFDYSTDNFFDELKKQEMIQSRVMVAGEMLMNQLIGRTHSWRWVRKNILRQSDEEMAECDAEIAAEMMDPQFMPPEIDPFMAQGAGGEPPPPPPEKKQDQGK